VLFSQGAGFDPKWGPPGYGLIEHAVVVGSASGNITSIAPGITGQMLMGSTAADPFWTDSPSMQYGAVINAGYGPLYILNGNLNLVATDTSGKGTFDTGGSIRVHAIGVTNTAFGYQEPPPSSFNVGSINNTIVGYGAFFNIDSSLVSTNTTAFGYRALGENSDSSYCSTFGSGSSGHAGGGATDYNYHVSIGFECFKRDGGNNNTGIGAIIGFNYASTEGNNIILGYNNAGILGDNNILRIGISTGSGPGRLNSAYISGIQATSVIGTPILASAANQLGVAASSKRFKENILDMGDDNSKLNDLRPVVFNYKNDADKTKQYGLIAEEVSEIFPDLVSYDKDGLPFSVFYEKLPSLLLNELKKLIKRKEYIKLKLGEI
jgi:hypothetical protein